MHHVGRHLGKMGGGLPPGSFKLSGPQLQGCFHLSPIVGSHGMGRGGTPSNTLHWGLLTRMVA
jgi:hypothetical protein